jgi:hypothetical protein
MWHVWVKGDVFTGLLWDNVTKRDHMDDPGVDGRIILRWIFRRWDVCAWTGSIWLGYGQAAGICNRGNKLSCFIK